jgi:hypothetical protein
MGKIDVDHMGALLAIILLIGLMGFLIFTAFTVTAGPLLFVVGSVGFISVWFILIPWVWNKYIAKDENNDQSE